VCTQSARSRVCLPGPGICGLLGKLGSVGPYLCPLLCRQRVLGALLPRVRQGDAVRAVYSYTLQRTRGVWVLNCCNIPCGAGWCSLVPTPDASLSCMVAVTTSSSVPIDWLRGLPLGTGLRTSSPCALSCAAAGHSSRPPPLPRHATPWRQLAPQSWCPSCTQLREWLRRL
jgi:hypothetical protein